MSCEDYFGANSFEFQLLERGIVVHHGKLPMKMTQTFTRLIEEKVIRVVLATSTLSEGVNLPFETIIFPSLRGPAGDQMTGQYIRNVVGRAGRPGAAREGRALVLIGTGPVFTQAARRYRRVVDELSGALEDRPARSAFDELIQKLQRAWSRLSGQPDAEAFQRWLESSAVVEETENVDLNEGLDHLDQFIISALAELHTIDGVDISAPEIELKLREIWQKTFSYAINPGSRSESAFYARARRVTRGYAEDDSVRQSYRTSLGPRSASRLFSISGTLSEAFGRAYRFLDWSVEQRLAFITEIVTQLFEVRPFDFRDLFGHRDPSWEDVLKWWMVPGSIAPEPASVGKWYSLANQAFAFRSSWAIASALLSILQEDLPSDQPLTERLHAAGIPWTAVWLRDMFSQGCLDPVQAAALTAGSAETRAAAMMIAQEYYSRQSSVADDVLEPSRVVGYFRTLSVARAGAGLEQPLDEILYAVDTLASELGQAVYRVWPDATAGHVVWRSVSGYPIAASNCELGLQNASDWDFTLDQSSVVKAVPYL